MSYFDAKPTEDFVEELRRNARYWIEHNSANWPCSVVPSRYSGAYESGDWLAFPCEYYWLNEHGWDSGDVPAMAWWYLADEMNLPIGRGANPSEALADCERRCRELFEASKEQDNDESR